MRFMQRLIARGPCRTLVASLAALLWLVVAVPAQAAVTITFWSHDLGSSFPHAFFTMRGTPDAGGDPIDLSFGFTAKTVSPALLFGSVPGKVERPTVSYMDGSDAQFAVVLTDAQYAGELALIQAWDETRGGDSHYNLNNRNCIHFVKEAARVAGLADLDQPDLMKKPRTYLQTIAAANGNLVAVIKMDGKQYLASLSPIAPAASATPGAATVRAAPDLHVLPPTRPAQPAGTMSTTSSVDSNPG
jgi:hypothetical protein